MRYTSLVMVLVLLLLAACANDDSDSRPLPTRIELPTDAPTADPTPTRETLDETPAEAQAAGEPAPLPTDPPTDAPPAQPTVTPSLTITPTPTRTPTATPTETPAPTDAPEIGALTMLMELALQATILPPDFLPESGQGPASDPSPVTTPAAGTQCQYMPTGGFGRLVLNEPQLLAQIGCPVGSPPVTASPASALQTFERGQMVWIDDAPGSIYVLYNDGRYQRFADTFTEGVDPEQGGDNPPAGLLEPVRGFGKVWRDNPAVRDGLGWATEAERGAQATTQTFTQGRMIDLPQRGGILLLIHTGDPASGTWRLVSERF